MKSFEEIKNELEVSINSKKEKVVNLMKEKELEPHQIEFFNECLNELEKMSQDMDLTAKKEICKRVQHIEQMTKAGKSMKDIEKFTGLGLIQTDGEIYDLIAKNTYDKSDTTNKIIGDQILNYYQIDINELTNSNEIKRTM